MTSIETKLIWLASKLWYVYLYQFILPFVQLSIGLCFWPAKAPGLYLHAPLFQLTLTASPDINRNQLFEAAIEKVYTISMREVKPQDSRKQNCWGPKTQSAPACVTVWKSVFVQ